MPPARDVAGPGFRRGTALGLGALAAGSFLFAVIGSILAPGDVDVFSAQADPYSRSAIGHRAFVELLREQGVPVVVSRHDSGRRAGASAALVVLEPRLDDDEAGRSARLRAALSAARRALIVLPKWRGSEGAAPRGHLDGVRPVPLEVVNKVLVAAGVSGVATRPGHDGAQSCDGTGVPTLTAPQFLQLSGDAARPLIACADGVLLAETTTSSGSTVIVLSDPDVLSNHGLGKGENALVAWSALEAVRTSSMPVLVDVALLGFEHVPSLWRELFAFPWWPATLQAALATLALLWAAAPRVGRPLAPEPELAPGKAVLIDNTAGLLRSEGHAAFLLTRYRDTTLHDLGRALHAPQGTRAGDVPAWLTRAGRPRAGREAQVLFQRIERARQQRPRDAEVVGLAARLQRFKEETIRGSR